jgi:hypothetical protein
MRRLILSLALISISFCVLAQTHSSAKNDGRVIQHVKAVWASVKWIIRRCDRQSTDRNADALRNSPTCVEADFDLNDGEAVTVLIRAEESQNEQLPSESLASLMVSDLTGKVRRIRSFVDLPMELHRAFPSRTPKDLLCPRDG